MSIFRSAEMSLWQLILQSESTYDCISELGELGIVEFKDLNPKLTAFQRPFTKEVRRCDDMERKIRYLEKEIKKEALSIDDIDQLPLAPQPKEMIDLEAALDKLDGELREVNANYELLKKNALELTELKHVLLQTESFLGERDAILDKNPNDVVSSEAAEEILNAPVGQPSSFKKFRFVAGTISVEKVPGFERMLFRTGRGNIYFRSVPIQAVLEDPTTGEEMRKVVFICFYQGEQLRTRVKKICDGYHASLYPCPETAAKRREMVIGVTSRIEDLHSVLSQTKDHRHRVLMAAAKNHRQWFVKIRKIKGIFHTMNMLNVESAKKCLIAECWIPTEDVDRVRQALHRGNARATSQFEPILNRLTTKEKHPTYFRTNKFTKGFQAVVNAYGLANYREVNPGLYTVATFPFLFAVMFGDLGHGFIVTLFALWMVLKEESLKKIKDEVWNIFFGGRYIILLMGLFSMYTGLIYNDVFSKTMNIFGSSYGVNYNESMIYWQVDNDTGEVHEGMEHAMLIPDLHKPCDDNNESAAYSLECGGHYRGDPYWFGIDPVWMLAENKIVYLNSYKMKLSIIIAVLHMSFGIFLNLWNYTYFKRYSAIFVEFLPRILFFWPLFGYLTFLMFLKWVNYGAVFEERPYQSDCAPSILITFINMMLMQYGEEKTKPPVPSCETVFFFEGQKTLQMIFLVVAILSVPVLLFGTPIIFRMNSKKKRKQRERYSNSSDPKEGTTSEDDHSDNTPIMSTSSLDEEEETFGDVMIHQAIHTIEYVLECISHTASYLRLWALSLAHAQLSEVLWGMVLSNGLLIRSYVGGVALFLFFAPWSVLTLSILIAMEGMSAFLHTLRLHWVEFQSKFYGGEGIGFYPFSFKHVSDDIDDAD